MEWGGDPDCWAFLPGPEKDDSDEVRLRVRSRGPAGPSEAGLRQVGVSSGLAHPPPGAAGSLCSCGRLASLHGRAFPPPRHSPPAVFRTPSRSTAPGPTGDLPVPRPKARKGRLRNTRGRQPESRGGASLPTPHAAPASTLAVQTAHHKHEVRGAERSSSRLAATPALEGFECSRGALKLR